MAHSSNTSRTSSAGTNRRSNSGVDDHCVSGMQSTMERKIRTLLERADADRKRFHTRGALAEVIDSDGVMVRKLTDGPYPFSKRGGTLAARNNTTTSNGQTAASDANSMPVVGKKSKHSAFLRSRELVRRAEVVQHKARLAKALEDARLLHADVLRLRCESAESSRSRPRPATAKASGRSLQEMAGEWGLFGVPPVDSASKQHLEAEPPKTNANASVVSADYPSSSTPPRTSRDDGDETKPAPSPREPGSGNEEEDAEDVDDVDEEELARAAEQQQAEARKARELRKQRRTARKRLTTETGAMRVRRQAAIEEAQQTAAASTLRGVCYTCPVSRYVADSAKLGRPFNRQTQGVSYMGGPRAVYKLSAGEQEAARKRHAKLKKERSPAPAPVVAPILPSEVDSWEVAMKWARQHCPKRGFVHKSVISNANGTPVAGPCDPDLEASRDGKGGANESDGNESYSDGEFETMSTSEASLSSRSKGDDDEQPSPSSSRSQSPTSTPRSSERSARSSSGSRTPSPTRTPTPTPTPSATSDDDS